MEKLHEILGMQKSIFGRQHSIFGIVKQQALGGGQGGGGGGGQGLHATGGQGLQATTGTHLDLSQPPAWAGLVVSARAKPRAAATQIVLRMVSTPG
jgi:hypothetical protein